MDQHADLVELAYLGVGAELGAQRLGGSVGEGPVDHEADGGGAALAGQLARRPAGDDRAAVDDVDVVGEVLGLAIALVGRPELVFVDEPTAGMDPQARRTTWELLEEVRADGVTVVLTTHHMDEAEHLADQIHIIDHGTVIASGTPGELTREGRSATIRLVVNRPFPDGAPESLRAELGPDTEVRQLDEVSMLIHGPADSMTLGRVSRWCEEHDVLPQTLNLGQRNLEDVFLELTGRELAT